MSTTVSRSKMLRDRLHESLRAYQRGPVVGNRQRSIIWDVTSNGVFVNGMTLDGFLNRAGRVLRDSKRVYSWQNTVVFEFHEPSNQQLLLLAAQGKAEPNAGAVLSNVLGVGVRSEEGSSQSLVPAKLVNALLADEDLWQQLPAIRVYARRALFDENFELRGPGWYAAQGILVHGPDIVPAQLTPVVPNAERSRDLLPPYLRRLLGEFCWASNADLENALALFLTGLLGNHFVSEPKPMGLIDGNQPEIGKTLLCQVLGQVLDGHEPERIPLVKDDELEKKVGAKLRESRSSLFFFDNVKSKIESAFVEANALSPLLSVRLLGHTRNINRPNVYLWLITSNLTSGSSDMITRGVPIRMRYEGNPVDRTFTENLLRYATSHRLDILGELAGMVLRWKKAGRPNARDVWPGGRPVPRHRCQMWVEVIGGILAVNGFTSFLSNVEEARASMDEGLQALATLAEYLLAKKMEGYFYQTPVSDPEPGKLPREWTRVFMDTEVCRDKLADKNARGRDTWVGTFLSGKVDRPVTINTSQGAGTAILKRIAVRNDQKRYFFEIMHPLATLPHNEQGEGVAEPTPASTASNETATTPTAEGQTSEPVSTTVEGAHGAATTGNEVEWF